MYVCYECIYLVLIRVTGADVCWWCMCMVRIYEIGADVCVLCGYMCVVRMCVRCVNMYVRC